MEPPFFVKGKLGLCVSVVTPVAVFMRIGGLNDTGRDGCSKVEPVIVRDSSGLSMRAEVGGGGRATVLRPRMIARGLLSAVSFAALAAWDPVLAEDKPVGLPEVKVIANTPLAPPVLGRPRVRRKGHRRVLPRPDPRVPLRLHPGAPPSLRVAPLRRRSLPLKLPRHRPIPA